MTPRQMVEEVREGQRDLLTVLVALGDLLAGVGIAVAPDAVSVEFANRRHGDWRVAVEGIREKLAGER